MTPDPKDYVKRRRDSVWERELARQLRGLPEEDRFRFITAMLDGGSTAVALELARRCLTERESFSSLLLRAVKTADPSTMQLWIKAVVHALGQNRVKRLLIDLHEDHPRGVRSAVYWLLGMYGPTGLLGSHPVLRRCWRDEDV